MGVYEERGAMHWQQSERYISSYSGSGELSPAAPAVSPGSPRDCTSCRKREPPDEAPQAPADDACAGCGARITDRFYLLALERRWHTPCLRCNECKMPLDTEQRCYARDSNIFCKNDYLRLYGSKRCARCNTPIGASELVMRARDLVFHVHCFSCALCSTPLNKGDTFGIRDAAVYCRLHYETMPEYGPHMPLAGPQMCPGPYPGPPPAHYPPYPSPEFTRVDSEVPKGSYFNGAAVPPPRQKGRPRKKKPKDQDIMTANLGMVPERAGKVAANGDEAGEQDGGEVFSGRFAGAGYVPRAYGLDPVAAAAQPAVQRDGGPAEPQLHGLSIAPALRLMSAVREPAVGAVALLLAWRSRLAPPYQTIGSLLTLDLSDKSGGTFGGCGSVVCILVIVAVLELLRGLQAGLICSVIGLARDSSPNLIAYFIYKKVRQNVHGTFFLKE